MKYKKNINKFPIYFIAFAKREGEYRIQLIATNNYYYIDGPGYVNGGSGLFTYKQRSFIVNAYAEREGDGFDSSADYYYKYFQYHELKTKLQSKSIHD